MHIVHITQILHQNWVYFCLFLVVTYCFCANCTKKSTFLIPYLCNLHKNNKSIPKINKNTPNSGVIFVQYVQYA